MSKLVRLLLLGVLVVLATAAPGSVRAETPVLNGVVGDPAVPDAFKINLTDATGHKVSQIAPGTYTIVVKDYSTIHNFHLFGPGVDQSTDIAGTGTSTWTVTFGNAVYKYQCDAHPTSMRGTFRAGTPPPLAGRLSGRVGPGRSISLRTSAGTRVKTLASGMWRITVKDLTRRDNFHLSGPGVNRRTGVRARGTVTWTVNLVKGKYRYFSDRHRRLGGTFTVVEKPPVV